MGGDIARAPRIDALFHAAGRDDAKRRERKRKRVVVGNYNRETIFVSKYEVVSRVRRVRVSRRLSASLARDETDAKRGLDVLSRVARSDA